LVHKILQIDLEDFFYDFWLQSAFLLTISQFVSEIYLMQQLKLLVVWKVKLVSLKELG
jgi:hypothetical protein